MAAGREKANMWHGRGNSGGSWPPAFLRLSGLAIYILVYRAGHVPPFFKLFHSVLEWGPSAKSFRSPSFFLVSFRFVPSCSIPFWVEIRSSRSVLFLAFLFKEPFHPSHSIHSQRTFPSLPSLLNIERLLKPGYLKTGGVQFVDFWKIFNFHNQYFNNIKKI